MQKYRKLQMIIAVLLIILFSRFLYLQIYHHQEYEVKAGINIKIEPKTYASERIVLVGNESRRA